MIPRFRAWDKQQKRWTNYNITDDLQRFYDKHTGCWKTDKNNERFVLMQSTGLKDENGAEIFEGDIAKVKTYYDEFLVIVKSGKYSQDGSGGEYTAVECLGFYGEAISDCEQTSLFEAKEIEVIGNIYENPELLEV